MTPDSGQQNEKRTPWLDTKYLAASGAVVVLLGLTVVATQRGWGLPNEASALSKAREQYRRSGSSVRTGSLHGRRYYGGGSGFGK